MMERIVCSVQKDRANGGWWSGLGSGEGGPWWVHYLGQSARMPFARCTPNVTDGPPRGGLYSDCMVFGASATTCMHCIPYKRVGV